MVRRGGKHGSDEGEDTVLSCPKCGAPRLGHAWDCAKCGYIFDAAGPVQPGEADLPSPAAQQATGESDPKPAQSQPAAPAASSARRQAEAPESAAKTPSRHTGFRGWVDENLGVAISLAVVVYLVVFAIITTQLVVTTDDATSIISRYRAIVGESPPTAFQPMIGVDFVGRRVQAFVNSQNGQFLLLYHEGWLAGRPDADRLAALPDTALGFLDIPYKNLGSRHAKMLHLPVDLRVIDVELAPDVTMRGYIAFFTGSTDRPALLCLVGDSEATTKMARTMFRE